jgi:hypothetical protein
VSRGEGVVGLGDKTGWDETVGTDIVEKIPASPISIIEAKSGGLRALRVAGSSAETRTRDSPARLIAVYRY